MLKPSLIQGQLYSEEPLECSKGTFKSEGSGGFLLLQKDIPNLYPKLLHPVHGIDKMESNYTVVWTAYRFYSPKLCCFFPEALTIKSKTNAFMGHLL